MKFSSLFAVLMTFNILTFPTFAQDAVRPNSQVEAKASQALLDAGRKLKLSTENSSLYGLNDEFAQIAIAFARLGRTGQALKAARFMTIQDDTADNGIFRTRDEVLRLSVRRSAVFGNVKNVENLIPQIKGTRVRVDALFSLTRAYLRKDDPQAAQKVLFQVCPLLTAIFDDPATIESFAKIDRARSMILYGLPDEGLRFLQSLQNGPRKSNTTFPPLLAYVLAQNHPDHFPNLILEEKSIIDVIGALSNYVEGLTFDIFNAPIEQEFVSDARGVTSFDG